MKPCLVTTTKTNDDIIHDKVACLGGASKESHDYTNKQQDAWIKDVDYSSDLRYPRL